MKKTLIATSVALAMGAGAAQAAFLQPGSSGTIEFTAGCFTFGQCAIGGTGNVTDNALTANGNGSGIAGDGLVGVLQFTTTNGNDLSITSYSQDTYTATAGGNFALFTNTGTGSMTGVISDAGALSLDLTGRLGNAQFFAYLGSPAWNIDNSANIAAQGDPTTGVQVPLTTGSIFAWTPGTANTPTLTQTGVGLTPGQVAAGASGTWTGGTIVSSGNIGAAWGSFDSTPYTEKFNINVIGTAAPGAPAVPVPAAVWLFGTGLLGLVGVGRRKKRA